MAKSSERPPEFFKSRRYLFHFHRISLAMKTTFFLPAFLAIPLASAAPFQPAHIPAEAQWFLHGDLTGLRKTETGNSLLKEIRSNENELLTDVEELFGFDLLSDLTDVTLFGNGKEDEAAIVLSGEIGRAHLEEVIVQADDYETSSHGTITIHHWDDEGKPQHAAFHRDQTVIISEKRDLVSLALDVLSQKKPGLNPDFSLPSADPVIVAFANIQKIDMPLEEGSRIIRKANSILITMGEAEGLLVADMVVETGTSKTATQMMHVLEGLVSLGELADEKIENLGLKHTGQTQGKSMTMSMSLPALNALALLSELK
jgi:hypothetical protein